MARPLKISRDKALDAAMLVFWTKGFNATSVSDLQEAMGIQRGSFYFQFKDKKALFFEVLEHYKNNVVEKRRQMIREAPSAEAGIALFFEKILEHLTTNRRNAGCLNTNSSVELGVTDAEISKKLQENVLGWAKFWRDLLEKGKSDGEFSPTLDTESVAQALVALTQGLNVIGKVNPDRDFLRNTIDATLYSLFPESKKKALRTTHGGKKVRHE